MKQEDDELWAYDEPHESGGNVHITMTRKQAIDWLRKIHPGMVERDPDDVFHEWAVVAWAYPEGKKDE